MVISPFVSAFFIAAVLAGALNSWHEKLARRVRGKRHLSAAIVTVGALVALILPLGTLGAIAVKETLEAITFVRTTLRSEGTEGLVDRLPPSLQKLGHRLLDEMPQAQADLEDLAGEQGG